MLFSLLPSFFLKLHELKFASNATSVCTFRKKKQYNANKMGTRGNIVFHYKGMYFMMYNSYDSYCCSPGLGWSLCKQLAKMLKHNYEKWNEWKLRIQYSFWLKTKGKEYLNTYNQTIISQLVKYNVVSERTYK